MLSTITLVAILLAILSPWLVTMLVTQTPQFSRDQEEILFSGIILDNLVPALHIDTLFIDCRLHSLYLSGSQQSGHAHNRTSNQQESHIVTSVLLERCGDNAIRHSNRIIPVIQEETRTPSPSNQLSPTIISVTPATPSPSHHSFQHNDTSGPSLLTHVPSHALDTGSISPDQLSTQSSPINR